MIAFAIKAALASNLFEHIIVSTDNYEIANIAKQYNAEVPFMRPDNLSDDYTDTRSVISHGIDECENLGWDFNFVCCIYPCVPLIKTEDIREGFNILNSSKDIFVFPIAEANAKPQRSLGRRKSGDLFSIFPEFERSRTQDLTEGFFDAGQFYWATKNKWLKSKNLFDGFLPFEINQSRFCDINNIEDWKSAPVWTPEKIEKESR